VEEFCKQVAVVRIFAKTKVFYYQDFVQIRTAQTPYQKSRGHSVILSLWALGGGGKTVALKKRKKYNPPLDKNFGRGHTEIKMQLSGNKHQPEAFCGTLVDLRRGDAAILDRIDLPGEDARRLMELGFLPGTTITAGFSAPGGDPRVFQVDGSEIALRRETARRMMIRQSRPAKSSKPSKVNNPPRVS
jgi:Fe2+ transport system protein FeoA